MHLIKMPVTKFRMNPNGRYARSICALKWRMCVKMFVHSQWRCAISSVHRLRLMTIPVVSIFIVVPFNTHTHTHSRFRTRTDINSFCEKNIENSWTFCEENFFRQCTAIFNVGHNNKWPKYGQLGQTIESSTKLIDMNGQYQKCD